MNNLKLEVVIGYYLMSNNLQNEARERSVVNTFSALAQTLASDQHPTPVLLAISLPQMTSK